MKHFCVCPKCGYEYNVSRLRDRTKPFVCADCENLARAKRNGWKHYPIYNEGGFATVKGVNAK